MAKVMLVTGATGTQGGAVVRALTGSGIELRALTRNESSKAARQLKQLGVHVLQGDLSKPASIDSALEGVDTVFSVQDFYARGVGYEGEVQQGKNLLESARKHGVSHFIQSTMAATDDPQDVLHFRSKFDIEKLIEASGLPYTFIGTVWFMENLANKDKGGVLTLPILGGSLKPDTRFHMLSVDDLAKAIAQVALRRDEFVGMRLDLASDVMTIAQIREAYEQASGETAKRWTLPNWVMRILARDFAAQLRWHNRVGWTFTSDCLRDLIGEVTDLKAFVVKNQIREL